SASRSSRSSTRCGSSAAPRRKALSCYSGSLALLLASSPCSHDQFVRFLVLVPRALAERGHAPRRDGMAAALRLPLAAAVRVVDGIHRGSAHGRTRALPARPACLAAGDVLVVDVADLSD